VVGEREKRETREKMREKRQRERVRESERTKRRDEEMEREDRSYLLDEEIERERERHEQSANEDTTQHAPLMRATTTPW
jgi:hypothetical protein